MKIKLLKDINDDYYDIHIKSGTIVHVYTEYMYNGGKQINSDEYGSLIIRVNGFGDYTYAKKGEYEIVKDTRGTSSGS